MKKLLSFIFFFFINTYVFADVIILNGLTHEFRGIAGNTLSGIVKMRNDATVPNKMKIYKQELILICGQESTFKDTISHEKSLTKWLSTNVNEKVMEGNEEYELFFDFTIPIGTKPGSYYTMLMVETDEPIPTIDSKTKMTINTKVRYGVTILVHVDTYVSPNLNFETITIDNQNDNSQAIKVLLKNIGSYSATIRLVVEIYSKGEKIKSFSDQIGQIGRIYPDKCRKFETIISGLPKGNYDGIVVADNGTDFFGSNITLLIE
jgi:hypothetical protein